MSNKKKSEAGMLWKPSEIGDELEGTFGGFFKTSNGGDVKIGDSFLHVNTSLKNIFGNNLSALKKGKSRLRVVFEKEVKTTNGKAKVYSVELNGEQIRSAYVPVEMKQTEIDDFFTLFE